MAAPPQSSTKMESLLQDIRYGARILWQTKGLALVAVASLAVGIGTNAAIFTLVNSILLRPRPVAQPDQLVELYAGDWQTPYQSISYPSYLELRERNQVLSGLAAHGIGWQFNIGGPNEVEQVWGEAVSGDTSRSSVYDHTRGGFSCRRKIPCREGISSSSSALACGSGSSIQIGHPRQNRHDQQTGADGGRHAPPEYTGMMTGWSVRCPSRR